MKLYIFLLEKIALNRHRRTYKIVNGNQLFCFAKNNIGGYQNYINFPILQINEVISPIFTKQPLNKANIHQREVFPALKADKQLSKLHPTL